MNLGVEEQGVKAGHARVNETTGGAKRISVISFLFATNSWKKNVKNACVIIFSGATQQCRTEGVNKASSTVKQMRANEYF